MELMLDITGDGWSGLEQPDVLVRRAAMAAFAVAGFKGDDAELSVVLADDAFVAELNQRWRGKAGPTNVLSFPIGLDIARGHDEPQFIGDIVLAAGVVTDEADRAGKQLETHLSHLVVHGVLHLLGYEHQDDEAAMRMQALETAAMKRLALPDPYLEQQEAAAAG